MIRPRGPVPDTPVRSKLAPSAILRATGEACVDGAAWAARPTSDATIMPRGPVPARPSSDTPDCRERGLAALAEEITTLARHRYQLHEDTRYTIIKALDGMNVFRNQEEMDEYLAAMQAKVLDGDA